MATVKTADFDASCYIPFACNVAKTADLRGVSLRH